MTTATNPRTSRNGRATANAGAPPTPGTLTAATIAAMHDGRTTVVFAHNPTDTPPGIVMLERYKEQDGWTTTERLRFPVESHVLGGTSAHYTGWSRMQWAGLLRPGDILELFWFRRTISPQWAKDAGLSLSREELSINIHRNGVDNISIIVDITVQPSADDRCMIRE